jgi:hypothetical protein
LPRVFVARARARGPRLPLSRRRRAPLSLLAAFPRRPDLRSRPPVAQGYFGAAGPCWAAVFPSRCFQTFCFSRPAPFSTGVAPLRSPRAGRRPFGPAPFCFADGRGWPLRSHMSTARACRSPLASWAGRARRWPRIRFRTGNHIHLRPPPVAFPEHHASESGATPIWSFVLPRQINAATRRNAMICAAQSRDTLSEIVEPKGQ